MQNLKPSTLRDTSSPKKRVSAKRTNPNVPINCSELGVPVTQIAKARYQNPLQCNLSVIVNLFEFWILSFISYFFVIRSLVHDKLQCFGYYACSFFTNVII